MTGINENGYSGEYVIVNRGKMFESFCPISGRVSYTKSNCEARLFPSKKLADRFIEKYEIDGKSEKTR